MNPSAILVSVKIIQVWFLLPHCAALVCILPSLSVPHSDSLKRSPVHYGYLLIKTNKEHNVITACEAFISALVHWFTVIWLKVCLVMIPFWKARTKQLTQLWFGEKTQKTRLQLKRKDLSSQKNKACRKLESRITCGCLIHGQKWEQHFDLFPRVIQPHPNCCLEWRLGL